MARPLRIEFPGAIYHVSSRMIGSWHDRREQLFRDDRDYDRFLDRLGGRVDDFGIRLYMFCLMSNHFHLVFETPEANLSRFMQSLSTAYTVYFNIRHQRHGHLLDGRFKSKLVSGDEYLLRLTRYVHQNPVRVAGWEKRSIGDRIKHLHAYKWSSYRGYIGEAKPFGFVEESPILAMMGGRKSNQRKLYRQYVDSGLATGDEEFFQALNASSCCIGDESFNEWVEALRSRALGKRNAKEDVAFRRVVAPMDPSTVMAQVATAFGVEESGLMDGYRNVQARAAAAKFLIRYAGRTQREAAACVGLGTGAAVCVQLKRLEGKQAEDRTLRIKLERIAANLERIQAAGQKAMDEKRGTKRGSKFNI